MNDSKENRIATGGSHVTPAGGNIFAGLGFPPVEAARLQGASRKAIEHRRTFAEALASMPKVGEDADFARVQDE